MALSSHFNKVPTVLLRSFYRFLYTSGAASVERSILTCQRSSLSHHEQISKPDCLNSRIVRSSLSLVELPNKSFTEYVFEGIEKVADKTALVCGMSGRSYTFGDLQNYSTRMGSALKRRGFMKGDVFAIISPNIPEFLITYVAVASIGGIVTTANPLYTADELSRQLNDCKAKFVMTIPHCSEAVLQAISNTPSVQEGFIAGEADGFTPIITLAMDDGSAFVEERIDVKEDLLCLPYSSGTTGPPKGVMLTHYNFSSNIQQTTHPVITGIINEDDTVLGLLPFFHIYSMLVSAGISLRYKAKLICLPRFEPEMFLNAIREYRPTIVPLVPPIISFLTKTPLMKSTDFDSVQFVVCGAAPLGPNICDAFLERIYPHKVAFLEGYGMTETSPVTLMNPRYAPKIGSCGVLVPYTEAKVVDVDNREAVGPMSAGELLVRGPQVMKGYFQRPKETSDMIDADGWLHTGDVATYDENEYFKIIDRLKSLIKVKGLQVSPSELEDLLLKHPGIQDAAVIGIPDSRAGELPRAYIVPKDEKLTKEDVESFISGQVAPHKALKGGIEFLKTIPKTQTGKILHRALKDQYLNNTKS